MTNIDEQNSLFSLIGQKLKREVVCYVIGGSAMLYYGAKNVTKDVDLVFGSEPDKILLQSVLKELGFRERDTKFLYWDKEEVPALLQRGDDRFDLFFDRIVSYKMTPSIMARATAVYEFGNLIVKVISPEDIILLKCATERAGDRLDAAELSRRGEINWEIIIGESIVQMNIIGDIIPLSLYDFLMELREDLKVNIPDDVIKKIEKIAYSETKKKIKEGKHIKVRK